MRSGSPKGANASGRSAHQMKLASKMSISHGPTPPRVFPEAEVANTMSVNQSTISRRKQAILHALRTQLRDRNEFQDFLHKDPVRCNLTNWTAGLPDAALEASPNIVL
jgi:hypothetical protein